VTSLLLLLGILVVAELVFIGVPSRVDYKYIALSSADISIREMYKPPLSLYSGAEIPKTYEASIGTDTLTFTDDLRNRFVPSLKVLAPPSRTLNVQGLSSNCAQSYRESESEILILWLTCAPIGESVRFVAQIDEGSAIQVSGVVTLGGRFTHWERAMP
jgi:hypothetical protein